MHKEGAPLRFARNHGALGLFDYFYWLKLYAPFKLHANFHASLTKINYIKIGQTEIFEKKMYKNNYYIFSFDIP